MDLSARIRHARLRATLSQTQLSIKMHVTRSSVSQWERSSGANPKTAHLGRLAQILQVQFEWLATGHGKMRIGDATPQLPEMSGEFAANDLESRLLLGFRLLTGRKQLPIVELIEKLRH